MLLLIDNYDSFTFNLAQYLGELGADVHVHRNDAVTLDQIAAWAPEKIVISPGPCTPTEAGISVPTIQRFAGKIPILGVCLGHQSIGAAFGGKIVHAKQLMHGKISPIHHRDIGVFRGLPELAEVLHQVEGEAVVVVDHQQHDQNPSSTSSAARISARALASVSSHSSSGTESATTPAAACT